MKAIKLTLVSLGFSALFIISGCKTTEPLYYYGTYQESVYSYFKSDGLSRAEQIQQLEATLEKAGDRNIPPGLHAHLGMLYIEAGNTELGTSHLQTEKELFPESASYIDFLLNAQKGA